MGATSRAPAHRPQPAVDLPLRAVAAEVGHQARTEGVAAVPALHHAQVARRLRQALPEAQAAVVLGERVGFKVTCGREEGESESCAPVHREG